MKTFRVWKYRIRLRQATPDGRDNTGSGLLYKGEAVAVISPSLCNFATLGQLTVVNRDPDESPKIPPKPRMLQACTEVPQRKEIPEVVAS